MERFILIQDFCSKVKKFFYLIIAAAFAVVAYSCSSEREVKQVTCMEDLAGQRVAILTGSLYDIALDTTYKELNLVRVSAFTDLLVAVSNNRADFLLIDDVLCIGDVKEKYGLAWFFDSDFVAGELCAAFNKNNTSLCEKFNTFLAGFKSSGEYDRLLAKWTQGNLNEVTKEHIEFQADAPVLRIGTSSTFPFTFIKNGEWDGFEIEMAAIFAKEYGYRLQVDNYEFSSLIAAISTNKIDIILALMTSSEERARQVLFSDPYYYSRTSCFGPDIENNTKGDKSTFATLKEAVYNNLIEEERWKMVLDGLWETIIISFFSIFLGTLFGAVVCGMRMSSKKIIRKPTMVFIDIIRGIPVLVFLMIMFYVVFATSGITARWVAILAFAVNFGVYVSEMFRTGIEGVDNGQREAGLAMGFTKFKTFFIFIVPQAAKTVLPVFKGEAVSLIKNTSIVGYIAIQDLTRVSDLVRSRTFDAFFPLILISIIYFLLAWLLGKGLDRLNNSIK